MRIYFIKLHVNAFDMDQEILTIEFIKNSSKTIKSNCCYRPPTGRTENFSAFLKNKLV